MKRAYCDMSEDLRICRSSLTIPEWKVCWSGKDVLSQKKANVGKFPDPATFPEVPSLPDVGFPALVPIHARRSVRYFGLKAVFRRDDRQCRQWTVSAQSFKIQTGLHVQGKRVSKQGRL